ncbi:MAG: ATP-binding protein [Candidatus Omnitrophota bacterium]
MMKYITRHIEQKLTSYIKQFPITVLTGPRQAGKSTLLKHLLTSQEWSYINLDQRGTLQRINSDPDLFVKDISSHTIIDEAQKAPNLFHSIKWKVDEGLKYKIVLSGSANFHLMHKVTETLAGRAGILELFPFSINEKLKKINILEKIVTSKTITALINSLKSIKVTNDDLIYNHVLWGGYPKIFEYKTNSLKSNWFENYRTTYIEKDLRDLSEIANINDFQKFYQLLSFQIGSILNLSTIANNIGITVPTCKKYLQILETSYQYFLLKPYHLNIRKRLIKRPKLYAWDTGLCNYFIGNSSMKELRNYTNFGNIFENFVIAELAKQNTFLKKKNNLYFWRTSNGAEVDLIIESGQKIIPIEIKHAVNLSKNALRGILDFMDLDLPKKPSFGIVFYRGPEIYRITDKILAIPIGL